MCHALVLLLSYSPRSLLMSHLCKHLQILHAALSEPNNLPFHNMVCASHFCPVSGGAHAAQDSEDPFSVEERDKVSLHVFIVHDKLDTFHRRTLCEGT